MPNPEYGRIVCHCERVTRGEIRDALTGPLPPADTDGLRRRTRALNGRCQGFYCAATVAGLFVGTGPPAPADPPGRPSAAVSQAAGPPAAGPPAAGRQAAGPPA